MSQGRCRILWVRQSRGTTPPDGLACSAATRWNRVLIVEVWFRVSWTSDLWFCPAPTARVHQLCLALALVPLRALQSSMGHAKRQFVWTETHFWASSYFYGLVLLGAQRRLGSIVWNLSGRVGRSTHPFCVPGAAFQSNVMERKFFGLCLKWH